MNSKTPALLVAAAALVAGVVACGSSSRCAQACNGCCTDKGECVVGNVSSACGKGGAACVVCSTAQTCTAGPNVCTDTAMGGGAGGGTAGGGGGGAAGGGGGSSAGGGSAQPQPVTISFMSSCPAFSRCGGDVVGTWFYTSGCVADAEFDYVTQSFGLACSTVDVTNKMGTITGSAIIDGGTFVRSVTGTASFRITASGSGLAGTCQSNCDGFNNLLSDFGVTGTCALSGADCVCDLTTELNIMENARYALDAGVLWLTAADGGVTRHDYCVSGDTSLRHRETTPTRGSNRPDPGVFTLTKQ